ncbi:MAG: hypothetical protein ACU0DH_11205 [Paracoccus sp. (in: a-proteobacteria)]
MAIPTRWPHRRRTIRVRAIASERREAEGLDGRHPEFGDLQREEDGALAGMGEEPLRSPLGLGAGVPMEGPRRISERGKKALLEEMMKRNGM